MQREAAARAAMLRERIIVSLEEAEREALRAEFEELDVLIESFNWAIILGLEPPK
jgi:hypothetical protein